jgi:hypothetical protein
MVKHRLPQEIIVFKNKDKESFQEHWGQKYKSVNKLCNVPAPFKWLILGGTNRGKSNLIYNILLHQKPEFEKIFIWTESPLSREYDIIEEKEIFNKCPTMDELTDEIDAETYKLPKSVLIVDDINLEALGKDDRENFAKIMKHVSSHFGLSVIVTCHDLIQYLQLKWQ